MSLACATGCTSDGRHLADCPCADPHHTHDPDTCPQCGGCQPRPAADRLNVCNGCVNGTQRRLGELPDLWVDLAERPRLAGITRAPDSEDTPPAPLGDDQIAERSVIKSILVTWVKVLDDDHKITVPDERVIAATTRKIAHHYSDQAAQTQTAVRLLEMPTIGPLTRNPEGAATLRRDVKRLTGLAVNARADRETGRDIIRAICEHLTRHADTLHAGQHAAKFVNDIRDAHTDARAKANKSRRAVTITCDCGGTVTLPDRPDDYATCRDCGERGVRDWWVTHKSPPPPEPLPLPELHTYLARNGLQVTLRQVRVWADAGWITPTNAEQVKRGIPRVYEPIGSLRVAEHLLAQPRITRNPWAAA